jgi:ribonucleoside-diphosphate reductase alpha chain
MELSQKAQKIFNSKYKYGNESWADCCFRVSSFIASAETEEDKRIQLEKEFFQLINELVFIPGGRILANAGTGIKNLGNCFTIEILDSRESIYSALKDSAEIFAQGGGVGFNASKIREEGAFITTTGGRASGPLSFATLFDTTGDVISQSNRRGGMIMLMDCDHPDVQKLIDFKSRPNVHTLRLIEEYKRNLELNGLDKKGTKFFQVLEKTLLEDQLTHFNISVVLSDMFMDRAKHNETWNLISRFDGSIKEVIKAEDILNQLALRAWESGEPGCIFVDRINEDNMVPYYGRLEACNTCSELPLFPNESCVLGSINLLKFFDNGKINFSFLEYTVRKAVRFLDNVQTLSYNLIDKINETTKNLRRIGLGVFGWADLLAELNIAYDSKEACELGEYLSWFISFFSWLESIELAKEKGPFPLYDPDKVNLHVVEKSLHSKFNPNKFNMEEIRKVGLRNVAITSLPPTGSTSLLADCCSSIEPFFALSYRRNITEGIGNTAKDFIIELNPILMRKLESLNLSVSEINNIKKYIQKNGGLKDFPGLTDSFKKAFSTSNEISWDAHIDMQAAWQQYIDSSISKTINLPEDSTVEDVRNAIEYSWNQGVKGITLYRNRSRNFQILNIGEN